MSTPTEIPEDRKQLIDALTSGYAFSDQDAEDMAELIEIGRLAVDCRKNFRRLQSFAIYIIAQTHIAAVADAYLDKQPNEGA